MNSPKAILAISMDRLDGVSALSIAFATLAGLTVFYVGREVKERLRRKGHARIPGPARLPVLGNALQIPKTHMWLTMGDWKHKYGMFPDSIGCCSAIDRIFS
jgi:hypothetical protein